MNWWGVLLIFAALIGVAGILRATHWQNSGWIQVKLVSCFWLLRVFRAHLRWLVCLENILLNFKGCVGFVFHWDLILLLNRSLYRMHWAVVLLPRRACWPEKFIGSLGFLISWVFLELKNHFDGVLVLLTESVHLLLRRSYETWRWTDTSAVWVNVEFLRLSRQFAVLHGRDVFLDSSHDCLLAFSPGFSKVAGLDFCLHLLNLLSLNRLLYGLELLSNLFKSFSVYIAYSADLPLQQFHPFFYLFYCHFTAHVVTKPCIVLFWKKEKLCAHRWNLSSKVVK